MKKTTLLCVLICLSVGPLRAQFVSSLHQVMSSTSLINRPQVFRDLQASIQEEVGKTEPGINLGVLSEKVGDIRRALLGIFSEPKVVPSDDDTYLILSFAGRPEILKIKLLDSQNNRKDWSGLLGSTEFKLAESIDAILTRLFGKTTTKDALMASLVVTLEGSGLTHGVSTTGFDSSSTRKLAKYTAGIMVREVSAAIVRQSPETNTLLQTLTPKGFADTLTSVSKHVVEKLKDDVAQALDLAEHELNKAVGEISMWFLSGNAGLGITEGSGAFAGGINASYVWRSGQIGLYMNGDLNKQDTSDAIAGSLVGIQGRLAGDRFQADLLISKLTGPGRSSTFEGGLGVSLRLGNDIIIGLAHFNVFEKSHTLGSTSGIIFKAPSRTSPALLIGVARTGGETVPIFQIATPILPSL